MICLIYCLLKIAKGYRVSKNDKQIIVILSLIGFIGILGNFVSGVQDNMYAILLDVLATYKNFIIYFAFKWRYRNSEKNIDTLHTVANMFRVYIPICAIFALLNLFLDVNMSSGYDFGLRNFKFIFDGSGNYAMPFYVISFSICMDCAKKELHRQRDKRIIVLMMFAWAVSLTTRSIVYVVLYLTMMLLARYFTKGKIKIRHMVFFGIITLAIGYTTIAYYFINNNLTARGALLSYSFFVLKKYFPIGAGFASYGSNMAAVYYSPLYMQFGFNNVWGLSKGNLSFANDSFWPEIFGQFGLLGALLTCFLLFMWYKKILGMKAKKNERLIYQWFFLVMLIGSSGTKTYIHFVTIGAYILLALYENTYMSNDIDKKFEIRGGI